MGVMTVFHGASSEVREPRIIAGRFTKDFGPGFYCTIIREQAERWARRFSASAVSEYEVRLRPTLRVREFRDMCDEWLDFIAAYRGGRPHDYDVVIEPMANDQVWNYVADFLDGIITRGQFWALARSKYPTHQIAFCSGDALKCLVFVSSEEVA